jgi:hypothetical protein
MTHRCRLYKKEKEDQNKKPYFVDEHIRHQLKIFREKGLGGVLIQPLKVLEIACLAFFRGMGEVLVLCVQLGLMIFCITMTISLFARGYFWLVHWIYG